MKKLIFLSMLFIIILATVVYSASYTTTDAWSYQESADQTNFTDTDVSSNPSSHSFRNFTDGDWDTYALVNGTYYMNYSKKVNDFTYLSEWQVKYNVSTGEINANESIPSACWDYNETKIILKVNTTNESNARYCNDGSWELIGSIRNKQAIYEEAIWWYVQGRTYNISYNLVIPAEYATLDNTLVNFSLNINDTNADINHTTFNCSIYIRLSSTESYRVNVSDVVIINNTVNNGTTITFADGNRVWWYWGCEDNYSRAIFNTTSRIFDIDLVYNILSIGANKVINLSVDSGEIVTKGGVKSANLTLTDGKIVNPLMNLTSNGELILSGGITAKNATLNKIVSRDGNITFHNASGTEWMRITNDGKIGIGKTMPNFKLDVNGAINASGLNITGDALIKGNLNVTGTSSLGTFTISNDLTVGNINISGTTNRIGIGTTTPSSALQVVGNTNISGGLNVTGIATIGTLNVTGTSSLGTFTILNDLIVSSINVSGTTNRIGIGILTPTKSLHVIGDGNISGNLYTNNVTLGTSSIFIDATNNKIGIGTLIPAHALEVSGSMNISGELNITGSISSSGTIKTTGLLNATTVNATVYGLITATPFTGQLNISNVTTTGCNITITSGLITGYQGLCTY